MIEYFPFPILELEYVDICYTISLTKVSYHAKQNQRKSQRERERNSLIKIPQHVQEPSIAVETVGMESL